MTDNIIKLARRNIQQLKPYQSARRIGGGNGDVWLNANESPISIVFKLKENIFNRYPECQPYNLIHSYSRYVGVNANQVLATRGADEGIELLVKAFCEPGKDTIMYCPPTYDMYRVNARIFGVDIKEIPTIKDTWQLDLLKIRANLNQVKLLYICNPNNPTGNIFFEKDLIFLLKITLGTALVVIDEAYIEFTPKKSMVSFLKDYPNLVILRTLSKAFSLAGIRCGFTLSHRDIINILNKVISPYPISIPVSDIAVQSLEKKYITLMHQRVLDINSHRVWLVNELNNIRCVKKVFESHANYLLVKFYKCQKVFQTLWDCGVILRNQSDKIHLKDCIRISIGTTEESLRLIQELKVFSENNIFRGQFSEK